MEKMMCLWPETGSQKGELGRAGEMTCLQLGKLRGDEGCHQSKWTHNHSHLEQSFCGPHTNIPWRPWMFPYMAKRSW